jgi:hypothetical protein
VRVSVITMTTTPDTMSLTVTREQAERLLALVDDRIAMTKNHVVSTLTTTIGTQAERVEAAVGLALDVEAMVTLRANIYRRLDGSLCR